MSNPSARKGAMRKALARSLAKEGWTEFYSVSRGEKGLSWPSWTSRIYKNNRFTVMIADNARTTAGQAMLAYIVPHNAGRDVFWKDLQRIKNEIFGPEVLGVQYFPKESKLIDEVNVYWLFVYPQGVLPEPL